ncbi:peptide-methionine (S)-S-oxide reductase MsrA [Gilvimarinus sp. F26214L]|uniref:peptide-methionine (S)-S-oxide reductase MsrA n=1 Tax=Gilvimarinus sp. DZF01 TaxID=3461371 RepID=UPI0040456199
MRAIWVVLMLMLAPIAVAEERTATFAGGCFWCMEPPFDKLDGVLATVSGYAGGEVANPTYEQVSSGNTGHQEVVQVTYDDELVSYQQLLEVFWINVDPVDNGGQFCDRGSQYLSGIFVHNDEQEKLAKQSKVRVDERLNSEVVTFIQPLDIFYPAEEYHQNYYEKNPLRYRFYRARCGRDARLKELWGD